MSLESLMISEVSAPEVNNTDRGAPGTTPVMDVHSRLPNMAGRQYLLCFDNMDTRTQSARMQVRNNFGI